MTEKRIIIVDDEIQHLLKIPEMLYEQNNEWQIELVTSASDALKRLAGKSYDVLITDLDMPEVNGVQLLQVLKIKFPYVQGVAMVGQSNLEKALKLKANTQHFLDKPCDCDSVNYILHKLLDSEDEKGKEAHMSSILQKMKNLPTLPDLYIKLKEELDSPNASMKKIAETIGRDISMTGKILQLVNSSFFALKRQVKNVQEAVVYIGLKTIKAIILTSNVFDQYTDQEIEKFNINELYRHSMTVGMLAGKITQTIALDPQIAEEAIMAGMLHDIGKTVFIKNTDDVYERIYLHFDEMGQPLHMFEQDIFGFDHADLGGYLLKKWGLPSTLSDAITYHHKPKQFKQNQKELVMGVYFANLIDHCIKIPDDPDDAINAKPLLEDEFINIYMNPWSLNKKIPQWLEKYRQIHKDSQALSSLK